LPDLVLSPCIFQELVTDCRELRVTVAGERVPDEVSRRLLALVRRLGLVFSTVDMKLTDEGEYLFLELNTMGQFLYVEVLSGLPLTAAVAELLAQRPGHSS
jgi:hypothetical protein